MNTMDLERYIDPGTADDAPYPEGVGTIVKVGRKYVYLRMDISVELVRFEEEELSSISDNAGHSDVMLYMHLTALGHPWKTVYNWIDHPEWKTACREYRKHRRCTSRTRCRWNGTRQQKGSSNEDVRSRPKRRAQARVPRQG